jgi:chorismate mutase
MPDIPEELLNLRRGIDEVDAQIVQLLIQRFGLTEQVGELKARQSLEAFDPKREADKLDRLVALCEGSQLDPELVRELFSRIMQEVVKNHRRLREARSQA